MKNFYDTLVWRKFVWLFWSVNKSFSVLKTALRMYARRAFAFQNNLLIFKTLKIQILFENLVDMTYKLTNNVFKI